MKFNAAPPSMTRPGQPYVLLVDDQPLCLQQLHEVVASAGHECVSAASATDAVSSCDASLPRVVVTDLAMPNLDGHGLARWLKDRFPSVPIILVTGEMLDSGTRAAFGETFTAVFSKPVDIESLLERLGRLMPAETGSRP